MAQQNSPQEPTMEEILASIRRIISEDAEETKAVAPAEPEPEPLDVEEDVLELDEVVEDDRLAAYAPEPEPEPEPEPLPPPPPPRPAVQAKPKPEPVRAAPPPPPPPPPAPVMEDEDLDLVDQEDDMSEGLLSSATSSALANAFGQLGAKAKIAHDPTNTLEDLVRELLKPILKDWLEENLPPLVERLVTEEIERVQRQSGRRR